MDFHGDLQYFEVRCLMNPPSNTEAKSSTQTQLATKNSYSNSLITLPYITENSQ